MTHQIEFADATVAFDDDSLRPRPWTRLQSDWATELSPSLPAGRVLELCAGVGHIGLVVARDTGRDIVQVETSSAAIRFAEINADAAGITVDLRPADMDHALSVDERFALVLADPPYIPSGEVHLFPDDPRSAIDGGPDGLSLLRRCVAIAARHLLPDGAALIQLRGEPQARELAATTRALQLLEVRSVDAARAVALFVRSAD